MTTKDHVHDCTGPDMTCPCGWKFEVARFSFSLDVMDGRETIASDGFNCEDSGPIVRALRRVADRLENRRWASTPSPQERER